MKLEDQADDIVITDDVEGSWSSFKNKLYGVSHETLGMNKKHHKDWFDENDAEISMLLSQKQRLHKAHLDKPCPSTKAACDNLRHTIQQKLRQMQDQWLLKKAEEIQQYADKHDMKQFYGAAFDVRVRFSLLWFIPTAHDACKPEQRLTL
jgi:hypothetical protein